MSWVYISIEVEMPFGLQCGLFRYTYIYIIKWMPLKKRIYPYS